MTLERKLVRNTFFRFLWPTLASALTLSVLSMTDLMIAGNMVGEQGLAVVSLSIPLIFVVNLIKHFLGMGGAVVFSSKLGEGDFPECSRIFTLSTVGALVLSGSVSLLGLMFLPQVLVLLGVPPELTEIASQYIGILLAGMPFLVLSPVLVIFLRNDSKQNYAMICVISSAVLNVILSVTACKMGLGMLGIGGATVVCEILSCVFSGVVLLRGRRPYGLARHFFSWKRLGRILALGTPVALICLCQIFLTIIINRFLSAQAGAEAYGVVKYMINLLFDLYGGVMGALQPMLGIYYGEREKKNIRLSAHYGFQTVMIMALGCCLMLTLGGSLICDIFGMTEPAIRALTVHALRITGFYAFSAGVVAFLNNFHRCVGKEKIASRMILVDNFIAPVCLLVLFVSILKLGSIGVFYAIGLSAVCTLSYYLIRYRPFRNPPVRSGKRRPMEAFWSFVDSEELKNQSEDVYQKIAPATMDAIDQIMEEVIAYCENHGVSGKKQFYIRLCIEELIVNVLGLSQEQSRKKRDSYVDVKLYKQESGRVYLRLRDNLTQWTPRGLDTTSESFLKALEQDSGVNEAGFSIIWKISQEHSYKRTIGYNNFSVIL